MFFKKHRRLQNRHRCNYSLKNFKELTVYFFSAAIQEDIKPMVLCQTYPTKWLSMYLYRANMQRRQLLTLEAAFHGVISSLWCRFCSVKCALISERKCVGTVLHFLPSSSSICLIADVSMVLQLCATAHIALNTLWLSSHYCHSIETHVNRVAGRIQSHQQIWLKNWLRMCIYFLSSVKPTPFLFIGFICNDATFFSVLQRWLQLCSEAWINHSPKP